MTLSSLFSSLRSRLAMIVLFAILPPVLLILYTGYEERRNAAAQAQESAKRLIGLASMHQMHVIDEAHHLLVTLSENLASLSGNSEECSAYLAEVLKRHPYYLNLGVIGANGKVLCSAFPVNDGNDLSDKDYFRRAVKEGDFAVGNCQVEHTSGKISIRFGYPLQNAQGRVDAVAFAAVDLAWLNDLGAHVKLPEGATFTVVARDGVINARYPEPERWVGKVVPNTGILKAITDPEQNGIIEANGIDGVRRLYAFTPLDDSPNSTFLYTGIPATFVYANAKHALTRNLVVLALVNILALVGAHLFAHLFVVRRVRSLVRTARQLAGGDLSARTEVTSGCAELDEVGAAFDEMAASLEKRDIEGKQMEGALRRSEARYRILVEQIPVVTYMAALNEAHTIFYISPQVESLLGFDQADFYEGRDTWNKLLHQDDRERVLKELLRCGKENDLFICEYRLFTFNGQLKWIRDEAVIVPNDAGEPSFMQGVMVDITDQRRSEEELLKARNELDIRVEERTRELAKANEDLRQCAEKLKFFAYSVVHDLKSPAIGAYGLAKLLQKQCRDLLDQKGMRYCDQIMRISEHIAELVEKINVYITTNESALRIESVNVGEILRMLREEFFAKLSDRGIKWFAPQAKVEVRADRLALSRVFRNCIDNALKYGGEQLSEIKIGYQELPDFHVFLVSDNGKGIRAEDAEKIFQMFERSSSSRGIEGAGLGLAIVKEIVEKHGGRVSVAPGGEKGVTFSCFIAKEL